MNSPIYLARTLRHWRPLGIITWAVSLTLYLTLPPSPDQFSHAYMGWRILKGDALYRDIFDTNWPGVSGIHALAIFLFGVNLWSWRLFDFMLFSASAFALADLIRLAVNNDAKKLGLILLPPIYAGANYWIAGQHDMTAAQFLVGAIWFYVRGQQRSSSWWHAGCGVFIALAMLNKPTVGIIAAILSLQTLWLRQSLKVAIRQTVVMMAAILAVLALALLLVLSAGASAREIFDLLYTFNIARREIRNKTLLELLFRIWSAHNHPWWYPSFIASLPAAIWFLRSKSRTAAGVALSSLWATGILSYLIQGSGVGYHLAPAFMAMAGASATSIYLIAIGLSDGKWSIWQQRFGLAFVGMALGMISVKLIVAFYSLPAAILEGDLSRHLSRFPTGNGDVTVADAVSFVSSLSNLAASDCLLVVGNDSALNYLSQHPQPTRFYYFDILLRTPPEQALAQRWHQYWADDLRAARCPVTLISHDVREVWLQLNEPAPQSLRSFLRAYRQIGVVGGNRGDLVYIRLTDPAGASQDLPQLFSPRGVQ